MSDADLSGTVIDGRYQVIEPIADGAMGSVYRGERLKLGRAVAIKIMHEELPDELSSRQRFEREAKLMALLEHPNCVSVIDFGVHDDKPFLVMDLVRGTSLLEVLEKSGQLDVVRASDIIRQVLSGLAHAHELGIVHRDIKPANIMVSEKAGLGQQVRILDFGLARLKEGSTKLTTGIVVGTPNYMAPEQCKGGDIDARTDLYACGVLLFEMLTGRKPFLADDPLQVVRKHLLEAPPTLASVEPRIDFGDLEAVVAKALAKQPADRFDSAVAMAKAVEVAAAKHTKTSAAALFARAVPETAAPVGNQLATMSGWSVPGAANSSVPGAVDVSSALNTATPSPDRQPDSTDRQPDSTARDAASQSGDRQPDNSVDRHDRTTVDVAHGFAPTALSLQAATPVPGSLPPLPKAAPYVSPARAVSEVSNGTPGAPLVVPPTRPSTVQPAASPGASNARPIPQLPFTKKQLMIGGGGLLALIILVAVLAGGGPSKSKAVTSKPVGSGSAAATSEPTDDPIPVLIERANTLLASDDHEAAVTLLRRARKQHPENAELAFLAGKAYFGNLWWSDGVDSFSAAIKLDPSYKENPELLKAVLKGFLTTPDVDDRITDFMRHELGLAMRPYLEETAEKHPKKAMRARARAELNAGR